MKPLRLGIAISGEGSNMLAIAERCLAGRIRAHVAVVVSDRPEARGLARAQALGIATTAVPRNADDTRLTHDARLRAALESHGADCVLLAGYMRILSSEFVQHYADRLLNIHPSLLPAHKGLHTHRAVLAARETRHGATVHYVTPELDGGPAVLQSVVPVIDGDDETTLAHRVRATEHVIYPRVVEWLADARLRCIAGRPELDGELLHAPRVTHFDAQGRELV